MAAEAQVVSFDSANTQQFAFDRKDLSSAGLEEPEMHSTHEIARHYRDLLHALVLPFRGPGPELLEIKPGALRHLMQMQQASHSRAYSAGRLRVLLDSISQLTRLADKPLQAGSESPASIRSGESEASHQHEPSAETVRQTCAHDLFRLLLDVIEDRLVEVSSSLESPFQFEHSTKL
ncbi:hypothetical protein BCR37DRAFT_389831 [Protomyces lactucae-debilis]|uniref:Uncharacterized protein n=1 Tax=Protomyces lactucae-debilis TaxID=2754530 RepID=A0A1Y2ETD0_PROLT|nr:uncharacterized protein BCR37DRAFT_389831 [Protomyces lactucae-debilis]ORY74564.1 hypothetical protein BCR37DRAFT_389831 [Protomyces lactucae-debilis]